MKQTLNVMHVNSYVIKGLIPTQVHALTQQRHGTCKKEKLSAADLALFTRQLATLLAAGIPVEESLRGVSEQTEKDKVENLLLAFAQSS